MPDLCDIATLAIHPANVARIVLIEDNKDLRDLLAQTLTDNGHAVWPTRDAIAGVTMCQQWEPDVLITDLVVPNSHALDKLAQPRMGSTPSHVVVISGALDSEGPAQLAQRLGGHVLAKPFRIADLVQLVDGLMTRGESGAAAGVCSSTAQP